MSKKCTNVRDRVIELVNVLKYVSECMGIQYKFHAYLKHGLLLFCNPAPHSFVGNLKILIAPILMEITDSTVSSYAFIFLHRNSFEC